MNYESSKSADTIAMSDMQHRNNSIDTEVFVDAQDASLTGVYINKGFDNDPNDSLVISSNNNNNMPGSNLSGSRTMVHINNNNFNSSSNNNNYQQHHLSKNLITGSEKVTDIFNGKSFSTICNPLNAGSASLVWNDLSFEVIKRQWTMEKGFPVRRTVLKQILKPQNGEIYAGSLTALMGPSGAGKSTLLNCLIGRYATGVKGEIAITCRGPKPKATISFVPQRDDLFATFTVRETLIFASRMKNLENAVCHEEEALKVMKNLNLESCANVKVARCSGGQVKRVCIGVELISNPDILVLDEPTTGLDSSTAAQCITLLKKLTEQKENPPAIVATIHQPNYKIFNEFHAVYLLSRNGQNIYFGSPLKIVSFFEGFNLICPSYCNPADYAIEVAYGDYGQEIFSQMESNNRAIRYDGSGRGSKYDMKKVLFKLRNVKMPLFKHTALLVQRHWQNMFRDSNQFWFKNIFSIAIAFIISFLWVYYVGEDDGCWEAFNSPVNETELKNNLFKINVTAAKEEYITKISRMADNSAFIFAITIYIMMISLIGCVLSFPLETSVILNQVGNNWYKTSSYFLSKTIADIPPMLLSNALLACIVYPMTGQIPILWRFCAFYFVICLVAEICQSAGMIFGILMHKDLVSAALLTVASSIPVIIFSGFLVRYSGMPWYFRPLSYISYMRYSFESLLIIIYGFGRCKPTTSESFVEKLLSSQDPKKIAGNLWESFNISYSDVKRYSYLLNVEQDCLGEVVNNTADYLGLNYAGVTPEWELEEEANLSPDYESATSDAMAAKLMEEPSYILSYYELRDSIVYQDIAILCFFIFLFKLMTYLLLRYKTRSTL